MADNEDTTPPAGASAPPPAAPADPPEAPAGAPAPPAAPAEPATAIASPPAAPTGDEDDDEVDEGTAAEDALFTQAATDDGTGDPAYLAERAADRRRNGRYLAIAALIALIVGLGTWLAFLGDDSTETVATGDETGEEDDGTVDAEDGATTGDEATGPGTPMTVAALEGCVVSEELAEDADGVPTWAASYLTPLPEQVTLAVNHFDDGAVEVVAFGLQGSMGDVNYKKSTLTWNGRCRSEEGWKAVSVTADYAAIARGSSGVAVLR